VSSSSSFLLSSGPHGACLRATAVQRLGRVEVEAALVRREVLSPWRGVLVDARRAGEPLTLIAAAQLVIGSESVVAGPSAAFLHGLTAVSPTPVHLVVPYENHQRSRRGIVVHNGLGIALDRERRHDLPVLRLDRVLTDVVCTLHPAEALAVLDQALARVPEADRPAARRRLRERLVVRPDPRGTRIGTRLIDLATGRAESPRESWLMWKVADLGFPVPEANLPVRGVDGRELYRLDVGWRRLRIAAEYDGYAAHVDHADHDRARRADLKRRGWIVVVVEADDPQSCSRLEEELDEAFLARGVDVRGRTAGAFQPRRHRDQRSN
jgi:GNAT superfamily N-acetyltransferase